MRKTFTVGAALMFASAVAFASVTFDPATGTGFVGKGDVQLLAGWNNKQLQDNADSVEFRTMSGEVSTWTCTKIQPTGNGGEKEIVQVRSNAMTTQGVVSVVARDNSKGKNGPVTGFNLLGFVGGSATTTTDGPEVGSCPANPSGFTYDDNAVTTPVAGGGLEVRFVGSDWTPIF